MRNTEYALWTFDLDPFLLTASRRHLIYEPQVGSISLSLSKQINLDNQPCFFTQHVKRDINKLIDENPPPPPNPQPDYY
jgi:hypothetical protein